jgi:hypothetical protein
LVRLSLSIDPRGSYLAPRNADRPLTTALTTKRTMPYQSDVDTAPTFPQALALFEAFLETHGLIDAHTRERTAKKFVFCSDGPFDVRDFVAKQCYISKVRPLSFRSSRSRACAFEDGAFGVFEVFFQIVREKGRERMGKNETLICILILVVA